MRMPSRETPTPRHTHTHLLPQPTTTSSSPSFNIEPLIRETFSLPDLIPPQPPPPITCPRWKGHRGHQCLYTANNSTRLLCRYPVSGILMWWGCWFVVLVFFLKVMKHCHPAEHECCNKANAANGVSVTADTAVRVLTVY